MLGRPLLALSLVAGLVLVSGCSGSSSSDDPSTTTSVSTSPAHTTAPTGGLVFTFTDAPTDEFVHVYVTIGGIELLPLDFADNGDDSGVVFVSGGQQTFDLLMLENVAEPFAIVEKVPIGRYARARLILDRVELVRLTADGERESLFPVMLRGSRAEFPLAGGVEIQASQTAVIQLDIDAARSIFPNGNGDGTFGFVPLVRAEPVEPESLSRLIYAEGTVRGTDHHASVDRPRLCEVSIVRQAPEEPSDPYCIPFYVSPSTSVFDEDGFPVPSSSIGPTDHLALHGRFTHDEQGRFSLVANVVELGGSAAFDTLQGVIAERLDAATNTILVDLDPGQGIADGSAVPIEIDPATKIYLSDSSLLVSGDPTRVGQRIELDGVVVRRGASVERVRAAIVFLGRPPAIPIRPPIYSWVPSSSLGWWTVSNGTSEWPVPDPMSKIQIFMSPPTSFEGSRGIIVGLWQPSGAGGSTVVPIPLSDVTHL
jgi:hypothetical protein